MSGTIQGTWYDANKGGFSADTEPLRTTLTPEGPLETGSQVYGTEPYGSGLAGQINSRFVSDERATFLLNASTILKPRTYKTYKRVVHIFSVHNSDKIILKFKADNFINLNLNDIPSFQQDDYKADREEVMNAKPPPPFRKKNGSNGTPRSLAFQTRAINSTVSDAFGLVNDWASELAKMKRAGGVPVGKDYSIVLHPIGCIDTDKICFKDEKGLKITKFKFGQGMYKEITINCFVGNNFMLYIDVLNESDIGADVNFYVWVIFHDGSTSKDLREKNPIPAIPEMRQAP